MEVIKDKTGILLAQVSDGQLQLGGFLDRFKVNVNEYKEVIDQFSNLTISGNEKYTSLTTGEIYWDKIAKSIKGCDETALSYFKTLDDGNGTINNQSASVEGLGAHLKATGQSFDFAAIKVTLLNTALNAGIFLVASLAIQGIVKALDNYIHRVEKAAEKTEEINNRIEEFNSTHKAHADLVENVAKRYEELSKGINRVDNSNISLSDDDYAEFLDISNQLVDAFPELYDGLDKNGNAILNIGTSAHSASEFLQELIDKEEHLTNVKIANELDDLFKNISIQIEDAEKKVAKFDNELRNLDTTWQNTQAMNAGDILDLNQLEVGDNVELQNAISRSIQQLQDELHKQLEENKIDADTYLNFVEQFVNPALYEEGTLFNGYVNLMSLSEDEKIRLQEIIKEQTRSLMEELEDSVGSAVDNMSLAQQNLDAIWIDFIPDLVSAMKSKANFKELEDVGLGDFAVSLVENLDSSIVNELEGTAYEDDIYGYVRDKILVPLQNAIKDESGNIDTTKLENVKKRISDAIDLKSSFDQNDISLTRYIDEVNALITVLEELGMSPDIIKNVKILFDYDDISDVQKRMNNSVNEISGYQQDNFGRGLNNKQTLEDKKKLQGYINKLTKEEYQLWLEVTAGIKGADNAIQAFETSQQTALSSFDPLNFNSENFSSVVDALASVQSLYSDFKEKVDEGIDFTFDFSDIENLRETFTNLGVPTAQFDAFERVLSSSSTTAAEAQAEFNAMATSLIYSTGCLDGLNSSNRDLIVSQLELQGIINASSVVTEELAMASEVLAQNGYSLADASETAYWSILNEAGASEATKAALYALNAAEIAYTNNGFSTQEKIDKLGELAKEYGDTATAAIAAAAADRVAAGHGDYESVFSDMMASVNRATQSIKIELPEVDARNTKSSASKAGKDAGKSFKDALKEELSDLDSVISGVTGRIDDQISVIKTQKEAALEAIDEQIDALEEQKSLLEDQKKALEDARDAAVEALEEERDLRIEVIEQQKKQLEEQIKLIDKQIKEKEKIIDGINDEIKAMQDANAERQRQIDLQKAQYELERLQHQRTILVN